MSPESYLAFESTSASKHEFVRGELFAMSGTTTAHNDVVGNLGAAIRAHLRGDPCRVRSESVKLRVEAANAFFYPDLFVTCDPRDREDPLVQRHATLVIEVLSESTAEYDRGQKFADYRLLPTLREFVTVDSRVQQVVVYRKNDGGTWEFHPAQAGGELTLATIGMTLAVSAIYEDAEVPATLARAAEVG
jgi:Uma2 family endonuclease